MTLSSIDEACRFRGVIQDVKAIAMKTFGLFSLSVALLLTGSLAVQAQNAASRARGDAVGNYQIWGHQVQTYQQHAQDRAQTLYYYSKSQEPLPKEEAKELVIGVRQDLTSANKALAKLKAEHAKEPDVLKQITLIEKHHARAHEVCDMAEEHCEKEHGDRVVIADCCRDMWHELDAAQAETQKLLKRLKIEKLPSLKKATDKKADASKETENKTDK